MLFSRHAPAHGEVDVVYWRLSSLLSQAAPVAQNANNVSQFSGSHTHHAELGNRPSGVKPKKNIQNENNQKKKQPK